MKILLFDMDGVLLEPHGYHRALQETVALVGHLLGYRTMNLTPQDVVAFEAAGVASEWDSSAISAVLLLENLWAEQPALKLPSILTSPLLPAHDHPTPDFLAFARSLAEPRLGVMLPLKRAEHLMLDSTPPRTPAQRRAILDILGKARQMDGSLTHRLFQELVLGSRLFAEAYGLSPSLDTPSYLLQHDRPTLSNSARGQLLDWLRDADHRAVIFTSRPSRPPDGGASTPEAEIGAQAIGLEALPILGLGGLSWLSDRRSCDAESFCKPSPIHALAALRLTMGGPQEEALKAAAALVLDRRADHLWDGLRGAQVFVFEDTVSGLESVRAATNILEKIKVPISVRFAGITDSEPKCRALKAAGATVTPSLSQALRNVPGF